MSKRISKRVREEAALLCAIEASNPELAEAYILVALHLGWNASFSDAYDLAIAAWERCSPRPRPDVDAEAEALIRSGWSP